VSIRNLDFAFKPRSVVLIGASDRPASIGQKLLENLTGVGFPGPILAVNPNRDRIGDTPVYPSVDALPLVPDLAVIATPAATVPAIIAELGRRGTRAAVVISAGFSELGAEGAALQQAMLDAARPHLLRIIGPNCVGILVPGSRINASFAHLSPATGNIAFATQSGAVLTAVLDWAHGRGIGFSHLISLGGMADVDFGDILDYLANDEGTRAILLYIEAVTEARVCRPRERLRHQPVIVCKAGRPPRAHAARSHSALRARCRLWQLPARHVRSCTETFTPQMLATGRRLRVSASRSSRTAAAWVSSHRQFIDEGGHLAELSPRRRMTTRRQRPGRMATVDTSEMRTRRATGLDTIAEIPMSMRCW
jgi:acetyltransferase